jgi:hypothetical protein
MSKRSGNGERIGNGNDEKENVYVSESSSSKRMRPSDSIATDRSLKIAKPLGPGQERHRKQIQRELNSLKKRDTEICSQVYEVERCIQKAKVGLEFTKKIKF